MNRDQRLNYTSAQFRTSETGLPCKEASTCPRQADQPDRSSLHIICYCLGSLTPSIPFIPTEKVTLWIHKPAKQRVVEKDQLINHVHTALPGKEIFTYKQTGVYDSLLQLSTAHHTCQIIISSEKNKIKIRVITCEREWRLSCLIKVREE